MSVNFTAIDFETANPKRGSVCAVGMAKFRDGQLIDQFYQLIDPPPGFQEFSHWNVRVHGINAQQVVGMPTWDRVHPLVEEFVGDDLIVAHNAAFDASVLVGVCAEYQIAPKPSPYLCTLELARATLVLNDFKLPTVAKAIGVKLANHHHALDDATVTGWIAAHFLADITRHDIDKAASVHSGPSTFWDELARGAPGPAIVGVSHPSAPRLTCRMQRQIRRTCSSGGSSSSPVTLKRCLVVRRLNWSRHVVVASLEVSAR